MTHSRHSTPLLLLKWLCALLLVGLPVFIFAHKPSDKQEDTPAEDPDIQYAADLLKPGTDAPDFTLCDIQDKPVKFSDLQGKTVALVFWASWCPDCRAEVPLLKEMYASKPADVEFVSVSFDREKEKWLSYVAENELPGIQVFDPAGKKESAVADAYGVKWIPSLYLIGPDGRIRLATVVAEKIQKAL